MRFLVSLSYCLAVSSAWTPATRRVTELVTERRTPLSRLHLSTQSSNVLSGVTSFENWFRSVSGAECNDSISHEDFGNLRGLSCGTDTKQDTVMKIPKSIVLDSDFSKQDWDTELAVKLWTECKKGSSSTISGYVELLTRGWTPSDIPEIPPSTAPDSLRHWSDDQLNLLEGNPSGKKVLDLLQQQQDIWNRKFSRVGDMTWEQFQWAMEVVHSRAFCGDFGVNSAAPKPVLLTLPLLSAVLGYYYYIVLHGQNDFVLGGLALIAGIPAIASLLSKESPVAVLLPLIDSANHLETADSAIDYSPLNESFTLVIGENCVVDSDGKDQLFINYGPKKDTELLLNYGFLQGVGLSDDDSDIKRRKLAECFLSRQ